MITIFEKEINVVYFTGGLAPSLGYGVTAELHDGEEDIGESEGESVAEQGETMEVAELWQNQVDARRRHEAQSGQNHEAWVQLEGQGLGYRGLGTVQVLPLDADQSLSDVRIQIAFEAVFFHRERRPADPWYRQTAVLQQSVGVAGVLGGLQQQSVAGVAGHEVVIRDVGVGEGRHKGLRRLHT